MDENGPFIDDLPIKTSIYKGFSMAMLVITRWYIYIYISYPFLSQLMEVIHGYSTAFMACYTHVNPC